MTYFDLTPAQRGFYKANNSELTLHLYLSFIEAGGGLSLTEYKQFVSGAKPAPVKTIPTNMEKEEKKISDQYICPQNLKTVMTMCRNLKFRYWKKAALSLYTYGYYAPALCFSAGGGYNVYVMTRKGDITKMFEKVHHRKIKTVISAVIESR